MNTSETNRRIDELEFKLQYQEDIIDNLNQVLVTQQKDLLLLQEKMAYMAKKLEAYRQPQTIHEGEKPPHY